MAKQYTRNKSDQRTTLFVAHALDTCTNLSGHRRPKTASNVLLLNPEAGRLRPDASYLWSSANHAGSDCFGNMGQLQDVDLLNLPKAKGS